MTSIRSTPEWKTLTTLKDQSDLDLRRRFAELTQGVIWGINSFDQWRVELGKVLATTIIDELRSETSGDLDHDASTNAQIQRYRQARSKK